MNNNHITTLTGFHYDYPNFKTGDPIKILFRKKTMNAKIYRVSQSGVDAEVSGKYYFCRNYNPETKTFENVVMTKKYN